MMRTKTGLWLWLAVVIAAGACSPQEAPASAIRMTFTPIPTFSFQQPTDAPAVATAAAATMTARASGPALDPVAVERGRGRYEALECGVCHGENGEGTADGSAMITYTSDEDAFISFMRSGGEMGADHQYSTNRLSDSGGRNLYQYLLSIRQDS